MTYGFDPEIKKKKNDYTLPSLYVNRSAIN